MTPAVLGEPVKTRRRPPRKKSVGKGNGKPRPINGELLDVQRAAAFIGVTDRTVYARVERRLLPFRRLNGRVVFLRDELGEFLRSLPGCDLDEAKANIAIRRGED